MIPSLSFAGVHRCRVQLLAASLAALVLAGCGTTGDYRPRPVPMQRMGQMPAATAPVVTQVTILPAVPDAQELAEQWVGRYHGVLPCPDCDGLHMSLTLLRDATYELRMQAVGASGGVTVRGGSFTFNADETRITLDANGQHRMFDILSAQALRMLDRNGQPVTGADAHRFILRKAR